MRDHTQKKHNIHNYIHAQLSVISEGMWLHGGAVALTTFSEHITQRELMFISTVVTFDPSQPFNCGRVVLWSIKSTIII